MDDLPPPDLLDSSGRARRIVLGLLIGMAAGALGYFLANTLIDPAPRNTAVGGRRMDRDTFVIWVGLISAVVGLYVALAVQNRLAKNKWRSERIPPAKVR